MDSTTLSDSIKVGTPRIKGKDSDQGSDFCLQLMLHLNVLDHLGCSTEQVQSDGRLMLLAH